MDVDPEVPEDAGDHEDGDYEICVTLETQGRVEISFDIVIGINDGTAGKLLTVVIKFNDNVSCLL